MNPWHDLETRLRFHYPNDWPARLQSYRDGSNPDVRLWRGIGGEAYVKDHKPKSTPWFAARNERIRGCAKAGVSLELLAERFGLSRTAISEILARFGERASR